MSDDVQRIPIIEEQARVSKRVVDTERVTVRTRPEEQDVVVREHLSREHVDVVRVAVDREIFEVPPIRTEGDVTIVPVVEERLVVEKRLFLIEELHLHRQVEHTEVAVPTTLKRTQVEVDRQPITPQENQ
jgi:stress response protein YsnF